MPNGLIVPGFFSSPSDAKVWREKAILLAHEWNYANTLREWAAAFPVTGEQARSAYGDHPQSIINTQLIEHCDFLIAVFQWELGTETEKAESGTVEEIETFFAAKGGTKLCIYFSTQHRPEVEDRRLAEIHRTEFNRLKEYQRRIEKKCLYRVFDDDGHFQLQLRHDLNSIMHEAKRVASVSVPPMPTRPTPIEHVADANSLASPFQELLEFLAIESETLTTSWLILAEDPANYQKLQSRLSSFSIDVWQKWIRCSVHATDDTSDVVDTVREILSKMDRRITGDTTAVRELSNEIRGHIRHLQRMIELEDQRYKRLHGDENRQITELAKWLEDEGGYVADKLSALVNVNDLNAIGSELSKFRADFVERADRIGKKWRNNEARQHLSHFMNWLQPFTGGPLPEFSGNNVIVNFPVLQKEAARLLRGAARLR